MSRICRTRTQQRIIESMVPNQGNAFEFFIKPDGSISSRRDLEAIEELIMIGAVRQVSRKFEIIHGVTNMVVTISDPLNDWLPPLGDIKRAFFAGFRRSDTLAPPEYKVAAAFEEWKARAA